jgi:hypothetical protein
MRRPLAVFAPLLLILSAQADFYAGFAREDVTPPPGMPMVGGFKLITGDGALDPLVIDCIAVSNRTGVALIFSVDDLQLSREFTAPAVQAVLKETGVARERLYLHATHTHRGVMNWPWSNIGEETKRLVRAHAARRIRAFGSVAKRALADCRPARIFESDARCPGVSFVRRYRMKDGSVRTNPGMDNPDVAHALGAADEMVRVIRFMRTGAPDIAIVNFGTHPDTVSGTKYSSDWPGVVRRTFEGAVGDGVRCLFLNAAQGDVNHFCPKPSPEWWAMRRRGVTSRHIGRSVAGAALSVWELGREVKPGRLLCETQRIRVPTHRASADELKWLKLYDAGRRKEIPLDDFDLNIIVGKNSRVRHDKHLPKHVEIQITYLRFGADLVFVGFGCEPFVDIARRVKNNSPFPCTLISCLTNGNRGYLVSTQSYAEGGYEPLSSLLGEQAGDIVIAEVVKRLKEIRN